MPALLELLAVCAFVVAQPVLAVLSGTSELLIFRQAGRPQIVLTAVIVAFAPPLVLFCLEVAAGLVSGQARAPLHRAVLACLVGIFALQQLQARTELPGLAMLGVSGLAAGTAAVAYSTWEATRLWMRLASPAPLVFIAVFLFTAPVSDLLASPGDTMVARRQQAGAPVVMIVLDELPLASLVDEEGGIDGRLYPNMAALAREATFFRNATGTAARTTHALPAMLTGRFPAHSRAPVSSQYPANLFALLAGSHDVSVFESVTALCPREACPENAWGASPSRNLLADAAYIWVRTLAPGQRGADKLLSWFGRATVDSATESRPADDAGFLLDRLHEDQTERFEAFIASIDGKGMPFHFLHLILPHAPWRFLPDGTEYDDRPLGMVNYEERTSELWPAAVNRQRHVLQAMWVDRLVGAAVARMKQVGLYDRAAVLVTADHGISFTPAPPGTTRTMAPENQHEVAWVPFLLKAPGQTAAEVRDDNVMGVDVAPTVATLAGVDLPWTVDGISLVDRRRDADAKAWYNEPGQPLQLDPGAFANALLDVPSRFIDLAGGAGGPYVLRQVADLVGLDLRAAVDPAQVPLTARVDDLPAYQHVTSPAPKLPALLTGHLVSSSDFIGPRAVVAVMNGTVAGASPLYAEGDQPHHFALMVDPALFRPGPNTLELFAADGGPGPPRLRTIDVEG
ncbi:MAG TPA: sulfatase-like hydrolase/transferase [Acidimicrobiales bacterium]|nr:sulfatase-like hydrolase/transferase [Acidimicrobiales bacterium]